MIGVIQRWKGKFNYPKIISLHGFLGNGSDFKIVADNLGNFSEIVAPDFPDYLTDKPEEGSSWDQTLSMLKRLLKNETPKQKIVLLGYSMGGRIALQFALQFPQIIEALILIGSTPGIVNQKERNKRRTEDSKLAHKLRTQSYPKFLEHWLNQPLIKSQQNIPLPYLDEMLESRQRNNPQTLAHYLSILGTGSMPSAWGDLHRCNFPTLLVTGKKDKKFTTIADKMLRTLPNASHKVIKGSGHAPCFENAKDFGSCLDTFLSSLKNGS